jgi:hypothetical protein
MRVPTKPAMRLKPGEYLVRDGVDEGVLVLAVAYVASRDSVTVRTTEQEHQYHLDDRVAALPRDE